MATGSELASVARSVKMQRRTEYYMTKGAVAVIAEAPATVGHADRVTYAKSVLDGTASAHRHTLAALTNATVAAAVDPGATPDFGVTDNDLEFAVNEHWNAMSGVETG